jgi:dihydroorotase-like cyclic amidohydrolase
VKKPVSKFAFQVHNLQRYIEDGTLSVVSSDHSPAPPADKLLAEGDFLRAWWGAAR